MFRTVLPRLYELQDLITDPTSPDAYFRDFETKLRDSAHVMDIYMRWEKALESLDSAAWAFLKSEASPHLTARDPNGRGWQQLFNILNQAHAYNYLQRIGCSTVRFIPRSTKRTPDLEAVLGSDRILCEVKTINISQDEVAARHSPIVRDLAIRLEHGFFRKLSYDIEQAKDQMRTHDPTGVARHVVYISPCFDDFFGECKEDYFRQIDQYLLDYPVTIEVVIHNSRTPFHTPVCMTAATVDNASGA